MGRGRLPADVVFADGSSIVGWDDERAGAVAAESRRRCFRPLRLRVAKMRNPSCRIFLQDAGRQAGFLTFKSTLEAQSLASDLLTPVRNPVRGCNTNHGQQGDEHEEGTCGSQSRPQRRRHSLRFRTADSSGRPQRMDAGRGYLTGGAIDPACQPGGSRTTRRTSRTRSPARLRPDRGRYEPVDGALRRPLVRVNDSINNYSVSTPRRASPTTTARRSTFGSGARVLAQRRSTTVCACATTTGRSSTARSTTRPPTAVSSTRSLVVLDAVAGREPERPRAATTRHPAGLRLPVRRPCRLRLPRRLRHGRGRRRRQRHRRCDGQVLLPGSLALLGAGMVGSACVAARNRRGASSDRLRARPVSQSNGHLAVAVAVSGRGSRRRCGCARFPGRIGGLRAKLSFTGFANAHRLAPASPATLCRPRVRATPSRRARARSGPSIRSGRVGAGCPVTSPGCRCRPNRTPSPPGIPDGAGLILEFAPAVLALADGTVSGAVRSAPRCARWASRLQYRVTATRDPHRLQLLPAIVTPTPTHRQLRRQSRTSRRRDPGCRARRQGRAGEAVELAQRRVPDRYLQREGVPAIAGIDTRKLTWLLRDRGAQNAASSPPRAGERSTSRRRSRRRARSSVWPAWTWPRSRPASRTTGPKARGARRRVRLQSARRFRVVVYDRRRRNILRLLADRGERPCCRRRRAPPTRSRSVRRHLPVERPRRSRALRLRDRGGPRTGRRRADLRHLLGTRSDSPPGRGR